MPLSSGAHNKVRGKDMKIELHQHKKKQRKHCRHEWSNSGYLLSCPYLINSGFLKDHSKSQQDHILSVMLVINEIRKKKQMRRYIKPLESWNTLEASLAMIKGQKQSIFMGTYVCMYIKLHKQNSAVHAIGKNSKKGSSNTASLVPYLDN